MSKIKILPEILSNKIAAGEVVERPASVVKELIENSLDADSTRIFVDVEKGGRNLIRVSDNGSGMSRDDALLAIERYATSKIYNDQDLFCIHTLGFRGEALPSIAAVSRFSIVTRDDTADVGVEIGVDGGTIKKVTEVGAPKGTMVTVRQLFFNTPARRKFLKTIGTEMGHIADRIASIALGNPGVHFRLSHNDKIVKDWQVTSESFDRVADVLGKDLKRNLHTIEFQNNGIAIDGWISDPRVTRRTSQALYLYVNGRLVRDRIIQHALFEGYSQRLVKGQFPVAVIFIRVPLDEVDVNVHPTKNEVRFARQREVHEAVRRAVAQTLYEVDRPVWGTDKMDVGQISESIESEFGRTVSSPRDLQVGEKRPVPWEKTSIPNERETRGAKPAIRNLQPTTLFTQSDVWPKKQFSDMRTIGQFSNSYIVCEAEEGLILIDQHASHERILYEKFSTQ